MIRLRFGMVPLITDDHPLCTQYFAAESLCTTKNRGGESQREMTGALAGHKFVDMTRNAIVCFKNYDKEHNY